MAYEVFAGVYDACNEDANYETLAEQLLRRLRTHGIREGLVVDLGCGTGDLTLHLADAGYEMIGVDLSEEMLCVLQDKMAERDIGGVLLLRQDLCHLDLYGTVQAAVSTFDTLNHIGPFEQFKAALSRCALFIEPDGLFMFDLNTPYKQEVVLANNRYTMENDEILLEWENHYYADRRATQIDLAITYKDDGETYMENFEEYAYTLQQIQDACGEAGLFIEEICDGETFGKVTPTSNRYLITARKLADRNSNRVYEGGEAHG